MINPLVLALALATLGADPADRPTVIVVVGAPGQAEYEADFRRWADLWQAAADEGRGRVDPDRGRRATRPRSGDRDRLRSALAENATGTGPLWLVLIGHGSFDGREAKFNLRGPDVTEAELAEWLAPVKRPVAILDCSSTSGPFLSKLSGENRVVVTATRSGNESNFSRFGQYLAEAIADPRPTSTRTARSRSWRPTSPPPPGPRSSTSPRPGSPPSTHCWTTTATSSAPPPTGSGASGRPGGPRTGPPPTASGPTSGTSSPATASGSIPPEVRRDRDRLELAIAGLRDQKGKLAEDDYYARLEPLMVELARLYGGQAGGGHGH